MRKLRYVMQVFMISLLVLSLAGQGFAAEPETTDSSANRSALNLGFNDSAEAAWAAESIGKMKSKNVLSGYEDGSFRPNQPVSRIEAVVTAVRLMGLEEQAKAKPGDSKLHFKDASIIDSNYSWAKGYVIVALEQGLFDITEDQLQPNTPASRVWVAGLLVKALGLQKEALSQMTAVPDFKDAGDIPAGAVGYVNIAVQQGIVSGYPDETFKPNHNVTRAEMAALLVRTNDNLLEQSGAVTIKGAITSLSFDRNVTDNVYSSTYGSITVQSFNQDSFTYKISPDLAVPYNQRFIPASQLLVGDVVSLTVENDVVLEASFINKETVDEKTAGINEFKMEIELKSGSEIELKYKNNDGKIRAEVEKKTKGEKGKEKRKGDEAVQAVEDFLKQTALTPQMTKEEIINQVLTALEAEISEVKELEIEIKFSNGSKVEIERENEDEKSKSDKEKKSRKDNRDDRDNRDKEQETKKEANSHGIDKFELEIKLPDERKLKLEYKDDDGKVEAKVEKNKDKVSGEKAILAVEELFEHMNLTEEMDKQEVLDGTLTYFEVVESDVKEFKLKIEFSSGKEVELEFENDDDDDE